jgi:transcriptional regulator with XRE-family HTH domain
MTMNCARQTTASSAVLDDGRSPARGPERGLRRVLVAFMRGFCDPQYPGTREGLILVVSTSPNGSGNGASRRPAAGGAHRRAELADFLRRRRAALQPEDVGLPSGGRRRTPGLRREELAQLAGVGTTWYTWLEQGRDVRASLDVFEAIARALRLTPAERTHLILLGRGEDPPPCAPPAERVSATLRRLIGNLGPNPAFVLGRRWDYLAWNEAATALFGDLASLPRSARNHVWLTFMDPARREMFTDWEKSSRLLVAKFRADSARHLGDPAFDELVDALRRSSPDFCRAWKRHEVAGGGEGRKEVRHPVAGLLAFEHAVLNPVAAPDQRLILYSPLPDHDTPAKLAGLLAGDLAQPPSPRSRSSRTRSRNGIPPTVASGS